MPAVLRHPRLSFRAGLNTTVAMTLGNTYEVLRTTLRKNILLCHRLKDLHQSSVYWIWNRIAFHAHKARLITEFPIGKDEFQVYLVGQYGQKVERFCRRGESKTDWFS